MEGGPVAEINNLAAALSVELRDQITAFREDQKPKGKSLKKDAKTKQSKEETPIDSIVDETVGQFKKDAEELQERIRQLTLEVQQKEEILREGSVTIPDGTIKLNVGGTIFEESAQLLFTRNSLLRDLFSGLATAVRDEDGAIFIDRDPTFFPLILSYLRGDLVLPPSFEEREELAKEANFYDLKDLVLEIRGKRARDLELGEENIKIKEAEDIAKAKFFTNAPIDPHEHLINVFAEHSTFVHPDMTEIKIPLMLEGARKFTKGSPSIVENIDEFKKEFLETCPLKNLNWNNVCIAGGSVLSAVLPNGSQAGFDKSDIDLFLYGLDEDGAIAKIYEIYECLLAIPPPREPRRRYGRNAGNTKPEICCIRTQRTITFVCGWPNRHVQIILRLYKSISEILLGFDLDCVGVAFDGKDVWCLPRCRRAINLRCNIADPSRQTFRTSSYEYRLWKYSKRGFAVAIPGFRREYINPKIYLREFGDLTGFSRLLYLEARDYVAHAFNLGAAEIWFKTYQYASPLKPLRDQITGLDAEVVGKVVDYNNNLFLPFGPRVSPYDIHSRLRNRYEQQCIRFGDLWEMHFIYGMNMEEIQDSHAWLSEQDQWTRPISAMHVPQHMKFIGSLAEYVKSLGDVENDWYKDAFL
eukprot:TRINITY_DN3598_c0_g1_i1.p1 TRINITY_DN3598_c0_g1~~TRINITY_DN3598_c0_g1_i1.p1  ORF type:complete len:666 (-),score=196.36 TRINITY_DN3598_c0_g1_i1:44-1963(-)